MRTEDATVGTRVRSTRPFVGVPEGTEGIIDEDYGEGVTVAWDLPDQPLPKNWRWDLSDPARWSINGGPLRDGFSKRTDLEFLEVVND